MISGQLQKALSDIFRNILVGDVMVSPARTIKVGCPFAEAEEIFAAGLIRHLPIVDDEGKLVGVLSQRDVYRAIAPRRIQDDSVTYNKDIILDQDGFYDKNSLNDFILKHVMRRNPQSLSAQRPLADAIDIMVKSKIGCVPVVDERMRVVGILTRFDILKLIHAAGR